MDERELARAQSQRAYVEALKKLSSSELSRELEKSSEFRFEIEAEIRRRDSQDMAKVARA